MQGKELDGVCRFVVCYHREGTVPVSVQPGFERIKKKLLLADMRLY